MRKKYCFVLLLAMCLLCGTAFAAGNYEITAQNGALSVYNGGKKAFAKATDGDAITLSKGGDGRIRLTYQNGGSRTLALKDDADILLHGEYGEVTLAKSLKSTDVTICKDADIDELTVQNGGSVVIRGSVRRLSDAGRGDVSIKGGSVDKLISQETENEAAGDISVPAQKDTPNYTDSRPYIAKVDDTNKNQPYYANGRWYFPSTSSYSYDDYVKDCSKNFVNSFYAGVYGAYISLSPVSLEIEEGHIGRVYAHVASDAGDYEAVFSTSNSAVATVNKDGTITARRPGTCIIYASVGAYGYDTCFVRVTEKEDD